MPQEHGLQEFIYKTCQKIVTYMKRCKLNSIIENKVRNTIILSFIKEYAKEIVK